MLSLPNDRRNANHTDNEASRPPGQIRHPHGATSDKCRREAGKMGTSHTVSVNVHRQLPVKWTVSKCLPKSYRERQSLLPDIPHLGLDPQKSIIRKETCTSACTAQCSQEPTQDRQHNPHPHIKASTRCATCTGWTVPQPQKTATENIMFPGVHRDGMEGSYPKGTQPDSGDHPHDVPSGQKKNQKHRIEFTPKERLLTHSEGSRKNKSEGMGTN